MATQGRPVWRSGNSAAQATANSVIASANRLIDVRHFWRKSSRIAEISVPAWPMPIHQTKLMMSNAQPTGMLLPQMPMPVSSRCTIVTVSAIRSRNEMPKPTSHPSVVRRVSTMALILSVTDANVCPGSMTGGRGGSAGLPGLGKFVASVLRGFGHQPALSDWASVPTRAPVPGSGFCTIAQIGRARPRVQLGEQRVVQRVRLQPARRGSPGR